MLTVGSLFSGIGGLDLGFERAGGFRVSWFCEQDPWCRRVLNQHWPGVPVYEDVLRLPADVAPVDVLAGGFPCQDISYAGKGAGLEGERSGLWGRGFVPAIRRLRPRFVVVENVAALLGRGFPTVLGDLASLGYDAEWQVLRARDVGAPHQRARLFIVAHHHSERREEVERGGGPLGRAKPDDEGEGVADSSCERREGQRVHEPAPRRDAPDISRRSEDMADATSAGPEGAGLRGRPPSESSSVAHACRGGRLAHEQHIHARQPDAPWRREGHDMGDAASDLRGAPRNDGRGSPHGAGHQHEWPPGPGDAAGWHAYLRRHPGLEPAVRRGADGIPHRVDRLRGLGNAVVPQVAEIVASRVLQLAGGNA